LQRVPGSSVVDVAGLSRNITDEEWIDLLICSIGFEPSRLSLQEKWLYLLRLVPFVEKNYNLLELGPKETGKTYFYRNMSSRTAIVSGGAASQAVLFYNAVRHVTGLIGVAQVV
jgi:ATP-dependent Lon protease